MANLTGKERADFVKHMFARLAGRYDRANRVITWGQDLKWRREVIELARLPVGGRLLDIGAGTGDLARLALSRVDPPVAVGADFSPEMIRVGRKRSAGCPIQWLNADALDLPFGAKVFDAVVSGYLLRNVANVKLALAEQYRVLKTGGRFVCLDTTPPPQDVLHLPVRLYLRLIIPAIGGLLTGDGKAYEYLPSSTMQFLTTDQLTARIQEVGFTNVTCHRFMGGTMAIHSGTR